MENGVAERKASSCVEGANEASERRLRKKSARVFEVSERKRGCLHIEPVIDRFGLRLAVEPPSLLTSRLDTLSIRLWSTDLDLGLVW